MANTYIHLLSFQWKYVTLIDSAATRCSFSTFKVEYTWHSQGRLETRYECVIPCAKLTFEKKSDVQKFCDEKKNRYLAFSIVVEEKISDKVQDFIQAGFKTQ